MVTRKATLYVRNIRYAGRVWIFLGDLLDDEGDHTGESLVVVCSCDLLGEHRVIYRGDVWHVGGRAEQYKGQDQLRADEAFLVRPYGNNFINAIAHSPRFKGIGTQTAKRLWVKFGEEIYQILDQNDGERLKGILKPETISSLFETWRALNTGEVLKWLDAHHFSVRHGRKIFEYYGPHAVSKITADPYRMISFESSWRQVDRIAKESFGISDGDPRRLHAAVAESLYTRFDNKHTACLGNELLGDVTRLVGSESLAREALNHCYADGAFVHHRGIFQAKGPWLMETAVSEFLRGRLDRHKEDNHTSQSNPIRLAIVQSCIAQFEAEEHPLGEEQKQALRIALHSTITVITGGAGVGKTSVLKCLFMCIDALGGRVIQMALSGRAARRMSEVTAKKAYTIAGFLTNVKQSDLEQVTTLVIDEASMLDLTYAWKIFQRLPQKCNLVLVGDPAQLPPIGPGLVFPLLARSNSVPVARLTRVYRQDTSTGIPAISHAVRIGKWPNVHTYSGKGAGVSIKLSFGKNIAQDVISIYEELGGPDVSEDVQILCATKHHRLTGSVGLNLLLHDLYTVSRRAIRYLDEFGREIDTGFSEGDPIMYTKNDWDRELFNGTLGRIDQVFAEPQDGAIARCVFDTKDQIIMREDIESIEHGYAITVHKSQGSQFKRVIVVLSASRILDRTLVYTAITRGVEQVVLVGDIGAASRAVVSAPIASTRLTGLERMLGLTGAA